MVEKENQLEGHVFLWSEPNQEASGADIEEQSVAWGCGVCVVAGPVIVCQFS